MTNLKEYIEQNGKGISPDWTSNPWASAQLVLHWLGLASASEGENSTITGQLCKDDAKLLCKRMVEQLLDEDRQWSWSSYQLETALRAVSIAVGGPPEPLLESIWTTMKDKELDENGYQFSRAFGRQLLALFRKSPDWTFSWLTIPVTAAQACFLWWTVGVDPESFTGEIEESTTNLLANSEFEF